jgi:hypothetical protein
LCWISVGAGCGQRMHGDRRGAVVKLLEATAPVTSRIGFFEHGFEAVVDTFETWWRTIAPDVSTRRISGRFPENLVELEPLRACESDAVPVCGWALDGIPRLRLEGIGPEPFDVIRAVQVPEQNVGRWSFAEGGIPLDFEDTEAYRRRRVRDRSTLEMLVSYCHELGVDIADEAFLQARMFLNID